MKYNKKGFTLVELLAVIVILAIIAVIAVPSILGIIEDARRDAFLADVRSAFKAAELQFAQDQMKAEPGNGQYNVVNQLTLENNLFTAGVIQVTETGSYIMTQIVGKGYNTGTTTGTAITIGNITAIKNS